MKNQYEKPVVQWIQFRFAEHIVASGIIYPEHGQYPDTAAGNLCNHYGNATTGCVNSEP